MERALLKLARQLNAYDEASLMALWESLADRVEQFEPSSRWEEAAIAFGMVQAVRWKNQLHNSHMAELARPDDGLPPQSAYDTGLSLFEGSSGSRTGGPVKGQAAKQRAKVLSFRPRESD
ncbi:hypothetical protein [Oleidesulfovibrio sp.]|uniref:hypothetical protein n=1 Tax=Oleidesulfovibrio sp. TaxID=2909707 RepID=UPI003A8B1739